MLGLNTQVSGYNRAPIEFWQLVQMFGIESGKPACWVETNENHREKNS